MHKFYSDFLEPLNPEQRQAVSVQNHHLRVLAGAGSGKTRVLISRIAWILQTEGLSPHQFLAVTFTNKAANEMRNRLETLLQQPLPMMWVGTFHGLAHRILREHWKAAGLIQNFRILDAEDQRRMIAKIILALNLDESQFQSKPVQRFINQQKDEGYRSQQMVVPPNPYHKTLLNLYQLYETACLQAGVIDFAELLFASYELLQKQPDILQGYHNRFCHLLVDEFQDTSTIQYAWIKQLTGPQSYLTIVGDDDQSIYSWRGARIENIQHFCKDFPEARTVSLEQNYRSTGIILSAANALIAHNQERMGKNLWTAGLEGEPISVYAAFSDLDEARFIVERIQMALEEGFQPQEIALLYRSNAQSRVLEEALIYAGIPYKIYGGLRFFERSEIKDALAYLRLICHPDDNSAFERIVNMPPRGLGERTLTLLRQMASNEAISLWQATHRLLQKDSLSTRAKRSLQAFVHLIEQLKSSIALLSLTGQTEHILTHSGLITHYQKETGERAEARLDNLQELIYATQQFTSPTSDNLEPLSAFLNHVALEAGEHKTQGNTQSSVQLMTLHAAKGLEFPLVFLSGLEEGLFPSHLSSRLEEERRLCYVGMTRAMRKLYLSYAEMRRYQGNENYRTASRFLQEIPEELLHRIRIQTSQNHTCVKTSYLSNSIPSQAVSDTGFILGQEVRHPTFGMGTILHYEGQGLQTRIQVKFHQSGSKWLIAHFAKLQAVKADA